MPTCDWLVLVGDSNTRGVYNALVRDLVEPQGSFQVVGRWPEAPNEPPPPEHALARSVQARCRDRLPEWLWRRAHADGRWTCDMKFYDQEVLLSSTRGSRCIYVSLRFLRELHEVERLARTLLPSSTALPFVAPTVCNASGYKSTFPSCTARIRNRTLPADTDCCVPLRQATMPGCGLIPSAWFHYPARPTLVRFSHGMWSLPNTLDDCSQRFAPEMRFLDRLAAAEVPTLWPTAFRVNFHPSIRNEYLEAEARCQMRTFGARSASLWQPCVNSSSTPLPVLPVLPVLPALDPLTPWA